jgi:hypothetical protein
MVWPSFSELQFACGVTRELAAPQPATGLVELPRIPTQHQEATLPAEMVATLEAGSTQLAPIFIQYRRAEKLTRPHAREWQRLADRGFDLSDGYFRFAPSLGENAQHNKLVTLGEHQPLVFYVAPLFTAHDQYRDHATNGDLLQHTAFMQCGGFSQVDSEAHAVTFTGTEPRGVLFSEPVSFPVRNGSTPRVQASDLEQGLTSFQALREEFRRLRSIVERDTTDEQGRLTDYTTPEQPTAEDPIDWMRQQQRFFREALNTDLLFFSDYDGA